MLSEAEILDHYNNGDGKPYDEPSGPTPSPNYNWQYEYDGLSRLVSACSDWDAGTSACLGDSFNYSYDGAGHLLSFSRWSGTSVESVNFVYNGANQIGCLDGDGNSICGDPEDVPYTYDPYGNQTSDGMSTTAYTYNGGWRPGGSDRGWRHHQLRDRHSHALDHGAGRDDRDKDVLIPARTGPSGTA